MKIEDYKALTAKILTSLSNQAEVSEHLTALTDDYTVLTAEHMAAQAEAERLKKENESLRDTNMKLFLKIGVVDPQKPETKPKEPEKPDLASFIDEHGNIK